jgi:putative SOS response-associated peptidase YedK
VCGRFLLAAPPAAPGDPVAEAVASLAGIYAGSRLKTEGEIFPTNVCPVLVARGRAGGQSGIRDGGLPGARLAAKPGGGPGPALEARAMLWGFPGRWPKAKTLINARCETADSLPTWRNPLAYGRCLIPAAGFFEWSESGGARRKYLITLPGGEGLFLAGISWDFGWDCGGWPPQEWPERFAIVTTEANGALWDIHERMPVVVRRREAGRWLGRGYAKLFSQDGVELERREL